MEPASFELLCVNPLDCSELEIEGNIFRVSFCKIWLKYPQKTISAFYPIDLATVVNYYRLNAVRWRTSVVTDTISLGYDEYNASLMDWLDASVGVIDEPSRTSIAQANGRSRFCNF